MATLGTETYGKSTTFRVLFVDPTGRRQTVRLGRVSKRIAETAKLHVEELLAARIAGHSVAPATAAWLDAISDEIHKRLSRVGLVEERARQEKPADVTLADHVDRYVESRARLKPNTIRNYEQTKRILVEHFGASRSLRSIHRAAARDYREWLASKYAAATVAREVKRARQFFAYAVDSKVIEENPFTGVKAGSQTNGKRKAFVDRDVIASVLRACPDNNWRLLVVLARYAGLRIPSELKHLTWSSVDWAGNRFTVRVKKKEHLDGHETRVVPIFPEIEPYLRQAFDEAPAGAVHVLPPRFHNDGYAYAGVVRAVEQAGVKVWSKVLVNLRASREIELLRDWPKHVVYSWIGHTEDVAIDHYLMVTDDDYERAAAAPIHPAQNPAHSPAFSGRQRPSAETTTAVSPAFASDTAVSIPPRGVEPRFSD